MKNLINILLFCLISIFYFTSCDDTDNKVIPVDNKPVEEDTSYFSKGADVSWLTEMEESGILFYNTEGDETECMALLKSLGMNAIRLRVWVNPNDGWCNKTDFLVKAKRASDLGMRLMVNFHYSDSWADPGQQTKPEAWKDLSFNDLCTAVSDHTTEVLNALKNWNITPQWVQVGNETTNGMLWDDGKASEHMAQYAKLTNAGYDAVKAVFPNTKVIVHVDRGNYNNLYRFIFDGLKNNNGKWDIIGMSAYPTIDSWQTYNNDCFNNIKDLIRRYNCEVMICEVGMPWNEASTAKSFLTDLIVRAQAISNEKCIGVFYWEPEAYNGWKGYSLGAFGNDGKPTEAMDAFK